MTDPNAPKNTQELPSGPADETVDIATPAPVPYTPTPPRRLREMTMGEMGVPLLLFGLALAGAIFVGASMANDEIVSTEAYATAVAAENANLTAENVALAGNLSAEQAKSSALLAVNADLESEVSRMTTVLPVPYGAGAGYHTWHYSKGESTGWLPTTKDGMTLWYNIPETEHQWVCWTNDEGPVYRKECQSMASYWNGDGWTWQQGQVWRGRFVSFEFTEDSAVFNHAYVYTPVCGECG